LHLGWDNAPMHRWGQAQMFRSLAFYLAQVETCNEDSDRCSVIAKPEKLCQRS
jgi:hypothetical protein